MSEPHKTYKIIGPGGQVVHSTDDLFEGIGMVKHKPAGWKLVRTKDSAVLSYTTGYKAPKSSL